MTIEAKNQGAHNYEPSDDDALKKFLSKKESNGSLAFKDYTPTMELIRRHKKRYMDAFGIKEELQKVDNV